MTWRCALIQRWLPGYLDAEDGGVRNRLVARHLKRCPDCRQELAELEATVRLLKAHPVPDPGPEFWESFQRELHLKLVQLKEEPHPQPQRRPLPVPLRMIVAAAPLAVLLVAVGVWRGYLPGRPAPALKVPGQETAVAPAPVHEDSSVELAAHGPGAAHPPGPEKVLYAGIDEGLWDEDLVVNWDMDPVLGDLSPQEREALARKLMGGEP
ncbi:MAG: zf-HC2 domain-containing protein [Desulfobaccales bacterium]